jgi:acetyl esterase/lipase
LHLKYLLIGASLCAASGRPVAAAANAEPATATAAVTGDHYPVRHTAFPGGVTGLSDVIYASIDGYRPLTLDLYLPHSAVTTHSHALPLIIFIHGGGWTNGHSRQSGVFEDWPKVLASIAARGYAVSSLNYRLSREAPFPAAEQDVKSAIRWLRGHAQEFGIDKQRVLVWGGSAGGQLAALTATSCGVAALEPPSPAAGPGNPAPATTAAESDCVQAAVTWYGVFDFATITQQQSAINGALPAAAAPNSDPRQSPNPTVRYLGCQPASCPEETLKLASPISFVTNDTPPMLLIHGTEDHVVPFAQSQAFNDAMKAAGADVSLVSLPGVDHSFVGKTAEQTRTASLQALNATLRFIDATVGKSR